MQVVDHFNDLFVACLNDMHIYYTQRGLYTFAQIIFKYIFYFSVMAAAGLAGNMIRGVSLETCLSQALYLREFFLYFIFFGLV